MAKKKTKKEEGKYGSDRERAILGIFGKEYSTASSNKETEIRNFNDYYDMLHCIRSNPVDDIESDVYMPEFISRVLTVVANFAARYFQSRDYVEVRLETDDEQDLLESKSAKTLLNTILGRRSSHYFEKIVRLLMFVVPTGYGVIKGGYSQKIEDRIIGYEDKEDYLFDEEGRIIASDGELYEDPYTQEPQKQVVPNPITQTVVVEDMPTFDVYPNQDVYFSPEYAYSLNDKKYIDFRDEKSLSDLRDEESMFGYFNLDLLEKLENSEGNQRKSEETYKKHDRNLEDTDDQEKNYTIIERWGKAWVRVNEYDENGKPLDYEPGYDKEGKKIKDAELHECIITWVVTGYSEQPKLLIRFQVSPHTRRPMALFKCYIDGIKDTGFGDGEIVLELQNAANDIVNLTNYRTMLATTPAFKVKKYSGIPKEIKVSPKKGIEVENLEDLQELMISDNIQGGMMQYGVFASGIDRSMAVYPHRMGAETENRESATAAAIMDRGASTRDSLRTLTLEHGGFIEFYDMLLTLCNDFMLPETLEKLIGKELAISYNPEREDHFVPVSQAIETEESKGFKIKMWDQILGRIVGIPNPRTPITANYIIGQIIEVMGGSFKHFKKYMLEENMAVNQMYQQQAQMPRPGSTPNQNTKPTQNQMGMPQQMAEQGVRVNAPRQQM